MIVVEHDRIELDYCSNCSGVWFDAGELELMLERLELAGSQLSLADIMTSPQASTAEKQRRCPICNRKMRKVTIGQSPQVMIDVCPRGDGLWFDGGEVSQIIAQCDTQAGTEADSKERILTFLGDTIKVGGRPQEP